MPWTSPHDIKKQNNFFSYPLFSFFFLFLQTELIKEAEYNENEKNAPIQTC